MPHETDTRLPPECHRLEVQQGRRYLLCTCGLSNRKPLCNGSHAGTGNLPDFYTADKTGVIEVCFCARSANAPLCDHSCAR